MNIWIVQRHSMMSSFVIFLCSYSIVISVRVHLRHVSCFGRNRKLDNSRYVANYMLISIKNKKKENIFSVRPIACQVFQNTKNILQRSQQIIFERSFYTKLWLLIFCQPSSRHWNPWHKFLPEDEDDLGNIKLQ